LTVTLCRTRQPPQQAAIRQLDLVGRPILHFERIVLVLAMLEMPRQRVDLLPERAAEGDVHLLEAATDAEHRQAGGDRRGNERQRRGIALGIMPRALVAGRPRIAMRLDVGGAAGEQDAVHAAEPLASMFARSPSDGISTGTASAASATAR
jgi:hypothetical protein